MKSITDKENPFSLKDDLKNEYQKLILNNRDSKNHRRKLFMKRKTLSLKGPNFLRFHNMGSDKNLIKDINNSELLEE